MMTQTGNWRTAAASVRGSSHEETGTQCQDAHHLTVTDSGVLAVAVADGAGSATHAEIRSATAARTAVETLAGVPAGMDTWRHHLRVALEAALAAVEAEAAGPAGSPRATWRPP